MCRGWIWALIAVPSGFWFLASCGGGDEGGGADADTDTDADADTDADTDDVPDPDPAAPFAALELFTSES